MTFNLLTEPVFRVETGGSSRVTASLPEVYAALRRDDVEAFPALRPHQRHAWHAFLVQLGAMALHKAGVGEPPADALQWEKLIRGLTADFPDDEPWRLVVDDITKPAFMQPPASSEDKAKEYERRVTTPDALDMLVTSKNHDLKSSVATQADMDDWIFALITLQTMDGIAGRNNYGISRMPSGYGNRSAFSITSSLRPGLHVQRDIQALLEHRHTTLETYSMADIGIGLVWTMPWDGGKSNMLAFDELDPFYIEICRRVRLRRKNDRLEAARAGSNSWRIAGVKGRTGDPWMPVGKKTNQKGTPPAFLGKQRFGYEQIVDGLGSPDWKKPHLLHLTQAERDSSQPLYLVARGMVRGEGKTEGYHERIIPLLPKAVRSLGSDGEAGELGVLADERIEEVGRVRNLLRDAIATFCNKGNDIYELKKRDLKKLRFRDEINRLIAIWDELVDVRFFDDLQAELEADEPERERIRRNWLMNGTDGVVDHARTILRAAEDALPCSTSHRYKTRAQARNLFEGRIRGPKGLPFLFQNTDEENE